MAGLVLLTQSIYGQTISGNISTAAGTWVPGITVTATRTTPFQQVSDTTDQYGAYSLGRLGGVLSGTYTVRASAAGYTFSPASTNVTVSRLGETATVNFTTPASAPEFVTALNAQDVIRTGATLHGRVNPNGGPTTVWFEYGADTSYGTRSTVTNVGSGITSVPVNISITSPLNATNVYFRIVASNRFGVVHGVDGGRSYPLPGTLFRGVSGLSPDGESSLLAYYDGRRGIALDAGNAVESWTPVDGNGAVLPSMRLAGTPSGPGPIRWDGTNIVSFSTTNSYGLLGTLAAAAGANYMIFWKGRHVTPAPLDDRPFRVYAIGKGSTALSYGRIVSRGRPRVHVTWGGDYIGNNISPYDNLMTTWMAFYANTHYGTANGEDLDLPGSPSYNVPANPNIALGAFHGEISDLIIFTNALSSSDIKVIENYLGLSGAAAVPSITTLEASDWNAGTIKLRSLANANGTETSVWFEWGVTTNYGNATPQQRVGTRTIATNVTQVVTGLLARTYHYRAVASNSLGVTYGGDSLLSPLFEDVRAGLPGLNVNSAAWGDYDNDGRLDILLARSPSQTSEVWRNTGTGFTNINAGLPAVPSGAATWGDYDNDGRLDILLNTSQPQIWRNTGSGFVNTDASLPVAVIGSTAGLDFDNDGRLDIMLVDANASQSPHQIWRNTGDGFTKTATTLPSPNRRDWADYDNDGRVDLVITSGGISDWPNIVSPITEVWRNMGGVFAMTFQLDGVLDGAASWGDYDGDGLADILLAGIAGPAPGKPSAFGTQIWRNTGSGFTKIAAGIPGVFGGSASWGDYDNDGRQDLLLTGQTVEGNNVAQIWRNTPGGFVNINAALPGVVSGSAQWGDDDNDGRLDILLFGRNNSLGAIVQVWRNTIATTNSAPAAPTDLAVLAGGGYATLTWRGSTDRETPSSGLTYNVRIGSTSGGIDVLSPAAAVDGRRRLPQAGNSHAGVTAVFKYTEGAPYYWSVQAVDGAFGASPFAPERDFKVLPTQVAVVGATATNVVTGDLNGDGGVDQAELQSVLANYWAGNPWLQMTNPARLAEGYFQFALTNESVWNFGVEVTTNFMDWELLGPAFPVYQFFDAGSTNLPQRYYRLRWPQTP